MINLDKVCEGVHYKLLDTQTSQDNQIWLVRILEGQFREVVMLIDQVQIDGKQGFIEFRVDSRKDDQEVEQSEELLDLAGDVIEDIIKTNISNGSMMIDGKDSGE